MSTNPAEHDSFPRTISCTASASCAGVVDSSGKVTWLTYPRQLIEKPKSVQHRHPITGCRDYSLLGLWAIEEIAFEALKEQASNTDLQWLVKHNAEVEKLKAEEEATQPENTKQYFLSDKGVAVIPINGPITKYPTSFSELFGGASTVLTQKKIRAAIKDSDVKSILLHIESPGGTVAGTAELADDILKLRNVKPIFAHADDLIASAAMWIGTQANRLTTSRSTNVGSIGTMCVLMDTSKMYKEKGIEPVVIKTGDFKAVGASGVKITDEQKKDLQRRIDETNQIFLESVGKARQLTTNYLKSLQAKVFIASEGKKLNLIDDICSYDEALDFAGRAA